MFPPGVNNDCKGDNCFLGKGNYTEGIKNQELKSNVNPLAKDQTNLEIIKLQEPLINEYINYLDTNGIAEKYTNKDLIKNIKEYYSTHKQYPRAVPDIAMSGNGYTIIQGGETIPGTTSTNDAAILLLGIYAIISSNIDKTTHGDFNKYLYNSYNSSNKTDIFLPVYSGSDYMDSNRDAGSLSLNYYHLPITYGWSVSEDRLYSNMNHQIEYGYDCVSFRFYQCNIITKIY